MFLNKITYDLHNSFGALISKTRTFHPKDKIYRKSRLDENLYTQDIHVNGNWTSNQNYQDFYKPINNALASLKAQLKEGKLELLKLPELYEDLETLEPVAEHFIENFNDVIVLGTGGSSLGGKAIHQLADSPNMNGPNLYFIDSVGGNIIKSNNLLINFKAKHRESIKPIGIVLGSDKIFLSLNNGKLIVASIQTGEIINTFKLDGNQISKPFIFDNKLYIIKDNSIIEYK